MIDKIKAWLPFLAGLGLFPKIIVTLIVVCVAVLILIALWWPDQISKTDNQKTAINPQKNIFKNTLNKNQQKKIDENQLPKVELNVDKNNREDSKNINDKNNILKLSADEYFDKIHLLKERFFERDEFIESIKKYNVEWEGTVNLVKKFGKGVQLTVDPENKKGSLYIRFPEEYNTKCYSLRKGDYIKFKGIIINPQPGFVEINEKIGGRL